MYLPCFTVNWRRLLESDRERNGESGPITWFCDNREISVGELVEKDSLNIREVELFKAVDCWTGKECEKLGHVAEGSVKRRILGERIVKGICFPVMEQKEIAEVVLDSNIPLTQRETHSLMKYFSSVLKTPVGFSEAKRGGQLKRISRFELFAILGGWAYSASANSIGLKADKNITVHAVVVKTVNIQ